MKADPLISVEDYRREKMFGNGAKRAMGRRSSRQTAFRRSRAEGPA
jgi:hypothetical protein